jgi:hypothetical protein
MKAAAVTSNGMRGAIAVLQRTPGQRVPMDDDPIQELWNVRGLLWEQCHEEAEQRLTRILDWRLLEPR